MTKLAPPYDLPARPVARARVAKDLRDILMIGMEEEYQLILKGVD
jgi:hypothetical protein